MLAPLRGLAPTPTGNPGSAPASEQIFLTAEEYFIGSCSKKILSNFSYLIENCDLIQLILK